MRAKDVMSTPPVTVGSGTPLVDVASLLAERGFTAVPVVRDGALVGIISEADILRRRRRLGEPVLFGIATDAMTRSVATVEEGTSIVEVARLMIHRHLRTVPVVSDDRVVGIITRRDLLRLLAPTDEEIRSRVDEILGPDAFLGPFDVLVIKGVVMITGITDHRSRRLAELLVGRLPGVRSVEFTDELSDGSRMKS